MGLLMGVCRSPGGAVLMSSEPGRGSASRCLCPGCREGGSMGLSSALAFPEPSISSPSAHPALLAWGFPCPLVLTPVKGALKKGPRGPRWCTRPFSHIESWGGGVWPSLSLGGTERCRVLSGEPPLWGSWGSRVALRSSPVASEPLGWKLAPWGSHGVAS